MKKLITISTYVKSFFGGALLLFSSSILAQTNVFDDVIALSDDHEYLTAALVQEELDDVLRNDAGTFTVFAPNDDAFTALADALGTDIDGLLALPNLSDILLYHVLGSVVLSNQIENGTLVDPVNDENSLKLTVSDGVGVFINHAQVTGPDIERDNGVVHVIDAVLLPNQTVVDIALSTGIHTTLVAAVIEARLLPALTNPLSSLTVFAPTDDAFGALLDALEIDAADLLADEDLASILLYHVVGSKVLSTVLENGGVATLNGANIIVNLDGPGVLINDATVILADNEAFNGVVHVLDKVLLESFLSVTYVNNIQSVSTYPNPTTGVLNVNGLMNSTYVIVDMNGVAVKEGLLNGGNISVSDLSNGMYIIRLTNENNVFQSRFVKN